MPEEAIGQGLSVSYFASEPGHDCKRLALAAETGGV